MGKIDDMRKQRELQFADAHPTERAQKSSLESPAVAVEEGRCSGCGKLRAVNNGLISNHQKGLGKMCAGSRKKPA